MTSLAVIFQLSLSHTRPYPFLPYRSLQIEERMSILKEICNRYGDPLIYVNHIKVKNAKHLDTIHLELMSKGAEGTIIRAPFSNYEPRRSMKLLKIKDQYDDECVIQGWEEGSNKNEGKLGALEITWEDPVVVKSNAPSNIISSATNLFTRNQQSQSGLVVQELKREPPNPNPRAPGLGLMDTKGRLIYVRVFLSC